MKRRLGARNSRLYALLVRVFLPRRLATRYGAQMQYTFALLRDEARVEGGVAKLVAVWFRELRQLVAVRRTMRGIGPAARDSRATGGSGPSSSGGRWLDGGADSIRQVLRNLRRSPGLTATVVVTFGLGIGANTAVFSVVNSVLLNPLPYNDADRMFRIWQYLPDDGFSMGLPYERMLELRLRSQTLERIEVLNARDGLLGEGDQAAPVRVGDASPGLFTALDLAPRLGRGFVDADAAPDAEPVVLLGEATWLGRFGAQANVIGRVLTVDGDARIVIGVVDESIGYLAGDVDLWIPMSEAPDPTDWLTIVAWRRPDVSVEPARSEMEVLAFEDERNGRTVARLLLPADLVSEETRALLYATLMAVSIVLLIASVNVAHLMLARAGARRREIAVRAALGASRPRIARGLLAESAMLALAGGALGALLAVWSIDLLAALRPDSLRIALDEVRIDRAVMGYALCVSALAGGLSSLAPIFDLWRLQPGEAMRGSGSTTVARGGGRIVRHGLLVAEVALSVVLLVGAGLLVHSLVRLQRADPGYESDGLLNVHLRVNLERFPDAVQRAPLYGQVLETVRATGAVESATLASSGPVHDMVFSGTIEIEATGDVYERVRAPLTWTAPGYFNALGIPILQGRDFNGTDAGAPEAVVIVNRTFAERFFAGTSAVGKSFRRNRGDAGTTYRIVGVVGDAVQFDPLEQDYDLQIYWPLWTYNLRPVGAGSAGTRTPMSLLVRVPAGSPGSLDLLGERLRPLGLDIEIGEIDSIRDRLSGTLDGPRFNAILFGAFAVIALALALALVGLYGVVSHAVERRAREMGIRMAIGARAADVRQLVLRQAMVPVAIGIVGGLAGAVAASRVIAGLLYLVEPLDPTVFVIVPLLLLLVAVTAIWVPALRATRVDPVAVMRAE